MNQDGGRALATSDDRRVAQVGATQLEPAEAVDRVTLIQADAVSVAFGKVRALNDVTLSLRAGECVAIAGHNGAGKSTLMNVLAGALSATAGAVLMDGQRYDGGYDAQTARALGIRCVFQELSLCENLTIEENMRAIHPQLRGWGWRREARRIIESQLHAIFPGHGLRGRDLVAELSLTQKQMVEIARGFAAVDTAVRLVILDEPSSSLDKFAADQLIDFVRTRCNAGISCLLITHMLDEMLRGADRILIMRDGHAVEMLENRDLSKDMIVQAMGQLDVAAEPAGKGATAGVPKELAVRMSDRRTAFSWRVGPDGRSEIAAERGRIVGLAGLAGQGQSEALGKIYASTLRGKSGGDRVAFVAGDRRGEGVFVDWSIEQNLSVRWLADRGGPAWLDERRARQLYDTWRQRIQIRADRPEDNILSLSGGNQQKVLFARALASDADLILMDDPMRGVDVGTKREIYGMLREEADKGRTFLWYTTEFAELAYCDASYIFHAGHITRRLLAHECTEDAVLSASFEEVQA